MGSRWRRMLTANLLVAGLMSGCVVYMGHVGQATRDASERAKRLTPPDGMALVYIVRPSGEADVVRMPVSCDGKELGTTGGKRFIYAVLDPGSHVFISRAEGQSELPIVLEGGKTYYIEQKPTWGMPGTRNKLMRLGDAEGREKLLKCSLSIENAAVQAPSSPATR